MVKSFLSFLYKAIIKLFRGSGIGRFYVILKLDSLIVRMLKQKAVIVDGMKLFLDSEDSLRLSMYGIYEPFEREIIKKEVRKGDVVLDIGANIGYYTVLFANLVKEKGEVFAFEPDPGNFALLKKNIEINEFSNTTLEHAAIAEKTGTITLFLCDYNKGDHRIFDSTGSRPSVEVKSLSLDDYFNCFTRKIDFIKMDVQGAEAMALRGMHGILRKNIQIKLITEYWPGGIYRSGIDPREFLRSLEDLGFSIFDVIEESREIKRVSCDDLLRVYTIENDKCANLWCVRGK